MHRREFLKALAAIPVLARLLPKIHKEADDLSYTPLSEVVEDLPVDELVEAAQSAEIHMTDKIFLLEPSASPLSLLKKTPIDDPVFDWIEDELFPL